MTDSERIDFMCNHPSLFGITPEWRWANKLPTSNSYADVQEFTDIRKMVDKAKEALEK